MSQDDLASVVESIKTSGLIHPIVLGKWEEDGDTVEGIVDGRNRLAACKIAGVEPRLTKLNGENVKSFIAAENLERRNMTASQKAMALAMTFPEPEERAKAGLEGRRVVKAARPRRPRFIGRSGASELEKARPRKGSDAP